MDLIARWNRAVGERYPDLLLLRKSIWRGTLNQKSDVDNDFPPRSLLWKVLLLYGTFDQKSWTASQERDFRRYKSLVEQYGDEIKLNSSESYGKMLAETQDGKVVDKISDDSKLNQNMEYDEEGYNVDQNKGEVLQVDKAMNDAESSGVSGDSNRSNVTEKVTSMSSRASSSDAPTRVIDDPLSSAAAAKPRSLSGDLEDSSFFSADNEGISYDDEEDLNDIIMRDVDRAFPEVEFFRQPGIAFKLHRILFIYAKQNREIGYRQGMHELAGPVLWVMMKDAPATTTCAIDESEDYVESDAFALFQVIMKNAKPWYLPAKKLGPTEQPRPPPIVVKSRKIQDSILRAADPELYKILVNNEIEPQIWGIRWIRLLFGREFGFYRTLQLWDALFAADGSTLDLIEYICATMLLRVRSTIIQEPHYAEILTVLLNYPTDRHEPPYLYVINALYLKSHLSPEGGRYVTEQFNETNEVNGTSDHSSQQQLPPVMPPQALPQPQKRQSSLSQQALHPESSVSLSPLFASLPSISSSGFNLDSLRDAAKTVSKRLDIDRRVRDAFEMQRRQRTISPRAASSIVSDQQLRVIERFYQDRSQALAEMLTRALAILEKEKEKGRSSNNNVQYSQALDVVRHVSDCLLDDSYQLDMNPTSAPSVKVENSSIITVSPTTTAAVTNTVIPDTVSDIGDAPPSSDIRDVAEATSSPTQLTTTPIRTSLANSEFSWMLDSPGPSPPDLRRNFKSSGRNSSLADANGDKPLRARGTVDIFELS